MKAIIIQDHDARALLDQLKLELMPNTEVVFVAGCTPEQVTEFNQRYESWIKKHRDEVHRKFHYVVTRWLQEQGADVLR